MAKNKISFKNKRILVIVAHPDDADFGAGGTMALAAKQGAKISYLIATRGQRGSNDDKLTEKEISKIREKEQKDAAKILGVKDVIFLDYHDGELKVSLELKERLVKLLKKIRPDYVFTMEPEHFYYHRPEFDLINHTDHRAIGEAAIDSCYPLVRHSLFFPKHLKQGLKPHKVKEIFLFSFLPTSADYFVNVTRTIELKLAALAAHKSQSGNSKDVKKWIKLGAAKIGKKAGFKYAEAFVRLKLRQ
jgi:LmbE family N-acetylglucosaminyl deacetylase